MSFTSRDLRGWFHIFTSLPLVHTSNPDFWGYVFDLASSWFPNPSFMKIFTYHDSRILQVSDRITSQVCDSRASRVHDFRALQVHDSRASQVNDSRASRFMIPALREFMISELRRFMISEFSENHTSWNRLKVRIQGPSSAITFTFLV
jgi:hypothetical protein